MFKLRKILSICMAVLLVSTTVPMFAAAEGNEASTGANVDVEACFKGLAENDSAPYSLTLTQFKDSYEYLGKEYGGICDFEYTDKSPVNALNLSYGTNKSLKITTTAPLATYSIEDYPMHPAPSSGKRNVGTEKGQSQTISFSDITNGEEGEKVVAFGLVVLASSYEQAIAITVNYSDGTKEIVSASAFPYNAQNPNTGSKFIGVRAPLGASVESFTYCTNAFVFFDDLCFLTKEYIPPVKLGSNEVNCAKESGGFGTDFYKNMAPYDTPTQIQYSGALPEVFMTLGEFEALYTQAGVDNRGICDFEEGAPSKSTTIGLRYGQDLKKSLSASQTCTNSRYAGWITESDESNSSYKASSGKNIVATIKDSTSTVSFNSITGGSGNEHVIAFGLNALAIISNNHIGWTLAVTYDNGTTDTINGLIVEGTSCSYFADNKGNMFIGIKAPAGRYIKEFTINTGSKWAYWDDLGFITQEIVSAPEDGSIIGVNSVEMTDVSGNSVPKPVDGGKLTGFTFTQFIGRDDVLNQNLVLASYDEYKKLKAVKLLKLADLNGRYFDKTDVNGLELPICRDGEIKVFALDSMSNLKPVSSPYVMDRKVTVYVAGDSINEEYKHTGAYNSYPRTGIAQMLRNYFSADDVEVISYAISGRSSREFKTYENYQKILNEIKEGDYLLVQFGHNDRNHGDLYTDPTADISTPGSYKHAMKEYVTEARKRGAYPIIATPIRRIDSEDLNDKLIPYVIAARELGNELDVPVLDMYNKVDEWVKSVGVERAMDLYMYVKAGDSRFAANSAFASSSYNKKVEDGVHLNVFGADLVAQWMSEELIRINHPLSIRVNDYKAQYPLPQYQP